MSNEKILNQRYHLIAQQGSGGMSVIYKAKDLELQRFVAVKILRPSLTQNAQFLEKFKKEARAVANLSHPNIVTVHDVGSQLEPDGQIHFIVMELVEGQDLKKIIQANGALSVSRALQLGIQICAGLGYAHRSGLVHADVKPQNILVTPQDVVKVTDFGIAQALSDTQPQQPAEVVWGSPHYFAPEQARGEQPTPAADVYAIGIVLFEMLTGQLPFSGKNQQELAMAHIRAQAPRVVDLNPTVPEALSKIVQRVMDKDPRRRYQMADQLGNVLRKYMEDARNNETLAPPPPGRSLPPRPPVSSAPTGQGTPPPQPRIPQPPAYNQAPETPHQASTERYPIAPNAPQPYNPRQQASVPSPRHPSAIVQQPQSLEQNYVQNLPPPPQSSTGYYTQNYPPNRSQPVQPPKNERDYVTIALAFLALLAVAGLVPLAIVVIAAWN